MILRSIVILVAMAAGTAFALDHPRLPHRVLHVISPAQLEATCPSGSSWARSALPATRSRRTLAPARQAAKLRTRRHSSVAPVVPVPDNG